MSKNQPMDGSRFEAQHGRLDYRDSSRKGLVDALSAHYGSPGRPAGYGLQFEKND